MGNKSVNTPIMSAGTFKVERKKEGAKEVPQLLVLSINPTLLFKALERTEFLVVWVLIHAPYALNTRQILRRTVIAYIEFLKPSTLDIEKAKVPWDNRKAEELRKTLKELTQILSLPKPEQRASYVNKLLKERGLSGLPTYGRIRNSLTNLEEMGVVIKREVTGKKENAVYYVIPTLLEGIEKKKTTMKSSEMKTESDKRDGLLYFNNPYGLDILH